MSLKKQKQQIIEEFLELGIEDFSVEVFEYVLLPFLEVTAQALRFNTAYFWSSPYKNQFATIQLQNVQNPSKSKRVLYIFASEQDAKRHPHFDRTSHRIDKLPIMSALLQFLTTPDVDSAVFYLQKGKLNKSKELEHRVFQNAFEDVCREVAKENTESANPVAETTPFGLA